MGAGSLMAPVLISMFGVSAVGAVGTDLLYSATTKAVGGWKHLTQRTVDKEISWWMAAGSIPASLAGILTLHKLASTSSTNMINHDLKLAIGAALILVAFTVALRTFFQLRGVVKPREMTSPLSTRHKVIAIVVGVGFGYVFGLTSVGAGAFFGIALILLFPLSAHQVVGTDLYHGALVTIPAAIASYFLLPQVHLETVGLLMLGSIPGILIGSQLMMGLPERAVRGSLATVLALSGLKLFGLF
jgi:uncharacterized protein